MRRMVASTSRQRLSALGGTGRVKSVAAGTPALFLSVQRANRTRTVYEARGEARCDGGHLRVLRRVLFWGGDLW